MLVHYTPTQRPKEAERVVHMSEESTARPPAAAGDRPPGHEDPVQEGMISARTMLRIILVLLTLWTAFSGLALVFFQGAADATIGGGLDGGEGKAAQRLLGVHLLVLAPIYGLLVWRPIEYHALRWVPYAAQGGVVIVTAFDILALDRDFLDGALPLFVAATFLVLLVYVWWAGRVPEPEDDEEEDADVAARGKPRADGDAVSGSSEAKVEDEEPGDDRD